MYISGRLRDIYQSFRHIFSIIQYSPLKCIQIANRWTYSHRQNYGKKQLWKHIPIHYNTFQLVQYNTIQSVHTFHSIAFHSIPLQFITVHYIILYCMRAYIVQVSFPPDGYDLTMLQQVCRTCTRRSNTVCSMTACCDCSLTWIGIDGCLDF